MQQTDRRGWGMGWNGLLALLRLHTHTISRLVSPYMLLPLWSLALAANNNLPSAISPQSPHTLP
jgi:hypothetical protein